MRKAKLFRELHWTEGCGDIPPTRHDYVVEFSTPELGTCKEHFVTAERGVYRLEELATYGFEISIGRL
jgi:hypothetical protein